MVRVLVGCPTAETHRYCFKEYSEAVNNLTFKNKKILLIDNSKTTNYFNFIKNTGIDAIKASYSESARDRIVRSRNILREFVLKEDYDYFLSLEQDVIPPKDVIERLLEHKKDINSGVYFSRIKSLIDKKVKVLPLLWTWKEGSNDPYSMADVDLDLVMNNNFIKIKYCGLGCLLISRKVLEKVKFRYDEKYPTFDDLHFCQDSRDNGFEIYSDTSVKCKHLILNRPWNWDDNKEIQTFKK